MRAKRARIAGEHEPGSPSQQVRPLADQTCDPVAIEVLRCPEDRPHAVLIGLGLHQGRVPGRRLAEAVGMAQQQRPRAPTRFRESDQQASFRRGLGGIRAVHQRYHVPQEIALLLQAPIRRVVGVPGQGREGRRDDDQIVAIGKVPPPGLAERVAPPRLREPLDRQHVEHPQGALSCGCAGSQYPHQRFAFLAGAPELVRMFARSRPEDRQRSRGEGDGPPETSAPT